MRNRAASVSTRKPFTPALWESWWNARRIDARDLERREGIAEFRALLGEFALRQVHAMIIEIPRVPRSPNYLNGHHWRIRHAESKLWREEIYFAVRGTRPPTPYVKARVTIDRRATHKLDPDNLHGCVKPVVDALRYARILLDDTADHIELTVTQSRGKPLTRIEINPV